MAILLIKDENGVERRADLQPLPFRIGKKSGHNALVLDHISISREHCVISRRTTGSPSRTRAAATARISTGGGWRAARRCATATRSGSGRSR